MSSSDLFEIMLNDFGPLTAEWPLKTLTLSPSESDDPSP